MAKRPRNKKVDRSIIEQGGVTPIRALTAALGNRRDRREDREYQESLEEMGMFDDAGGRGRADAGDQGREEFRGRAQRMKAGGKVKKYQMGGMPMADETPMKRKKKKRPMDDMMAVMGTGAGAPRRGMKSGGKVRGCGAVSKKMRPTKMVKMKGS